MAYFQRILLMTAVTGKDLRGLRGGLVLVLATVGLARFYFKDIQRSMMMILMSKHSHFLLSLQASKFHIAPLVGEGRRARHAAFTSSFFLKSCTTCL